MKRILEVAGICYGCGGNSDGGRERVDGSCFYKMLLLWVFTWDLV